MRDVIVRYGLPWNVVAAGLQGRVHVPPASPPRTGGEAAAAEDHDLDTLMHLHALNRGVLMTPFHNMALMSPATTEDDVDLHTAVFEQAARDLVGSP